MDMNEDFWTAGLCITDLNRLHWIRFWCVIGAGKFWTPIQETCFQRLATSAPTV